MGTYTDKSTARLAGKKDKKSLSGVQARELVKTVRDNVQSAYEHERKNIEEANLDQRFLANDQWPTEARAARERDGRPVLTFNRLPSFVNQVVNPIRQADKAIKAKPDDDAADPKLAKVVDGLFRKIQRQSMARQVFGHVVNCQAGCGIGWLRICNDYRTDRSFDQDIFIEKIDNPLSVFWDPAARDPVRSDAMWMAVTEMWPEATFRAKWPDAALESAENPATEVSDTGFYWRTDNDIRIVEYYKRTPVEKTLARLVSGEIIDITDMGEAEAGQLPVEMTRTVQSHRVEKYILTGAEVLEGPVEIPGEYIPLVPAVGGEIALERGMYRYGVIRFARDPQMMYNLNRSSMAEWIGQAPKTPYLVTPRMIANHRDQWDTINATNRNYLPYTPDKDAPGMRPERVTPVQIPTGLANEAQFAAEDMKAGTGIFDASLGAKSNETSGVAIRARQLEGDITHYHFADNFEATLTHVGNIIMQWIPVIYDTPRTVILVGEDGTETPTPINTPQIDPQTGEMVIVNDLRNIRFAVQVDIGPSYSTRRIESAEQIGEFMKAIPPQQAALITDVYARNQDWEGHEEIAKRLRATIPPEIAAATEEGPDGQPLQLPPPPPSPIEVAQLEKITAEIEEIKARAAKTIVEAKQLDRQDQLIDYPGAGPNGETVRVPRQVVDRNPLQGGAVA